MSQPIDRRELLSLGAAAAIGLSTTPIAGAQPPAQSTPQPASKLTPKTVRPVRIGVVGTGARGRTLLGLLLKIDGVQIPAVCDINPAALKAAQDLVSAAGQPRPAGYGDSDTAFRKLMERDDLDAILIATYWQWHTPMAVYAMQCGKYTAVEVPAALSFDECWQLVDTHEKTGVPCMMLENWSFRRDNLAVLNMIRAGLFGEIVHCHCAHSHNCIDHWFFDEQGNIRWGGEFLVRYNRDQYPTHSLGPVLSWMNIGCGDYFKTVTSTATRSSGINAMFRRKFGPDHPNATRKYAQGDIVTSLITTHHGSTIVVNYDMQLPRPYDNRWLIQGTLGIYREEPPTVYLEGHSPEYEKWEPFAPYQEKYDHAWWRASGPTPDAASHGGADYLELLHFVDAVRHKTPTPLDVYDSVAMSALIPLSEASLAQGGAPIACPDFTRGKWKTTKPKFALP